MHNPDNPNAKWKKEDCELLAKLWKSGEPISFIAQAFGVTRNAVVGIRFRLGLPRRQRPTKGAEYQMTRKPTYFR